jgi:hypothetical protein
MELAKVEALASGHRSDFERERERAVTHSPIRANVRIQFPQLLVSCWGVE